MTENANGQSSKRLFLRAAKSRARDEDRAAGCVCPNVKYSATLTESRVDGKVDASIDVTSTNHSPTCPAIFEQSVLKEDPDE